MCKCKCSVDGCMAEVAEKEKLVKWHTINKMITKKGKHNYSISKRGAIFCFKTNTHSALNCIA